MTFWRHQRRQSDRRPAIVGKAQERRAVGKKALVQRDAVGDRGHRMLAHAEMDVASVEVSRDSSGIPSGGLRLLEVRIRRTADQVGDDRHQRLHDRLRRLAGRLLGLSLRPSAPCRPAAPRASLSADRRRSRTGSARAARLPLRCRRSHQRFCIDRAAPTGVRHAASTSAGDLEGRMRPVERQHARRRPRRRWASGHGRPRCRPCPAARARSPSGKR